MKIVDENNQVQIESLINECKGNLFEFLVTQHLSKIFEGEEHFLLNLPMDYRSRLQFYEATVRKHNLGLLSQLPIMAQLVAKKLSSEPIFENKVNNIASFSFFVIGKLTSGNDSDCWSETDIVVTKKTGTDNSELEKFYLSLKLTKDHSFTNTKSAGVKSFFEKYFFKLDPLIAKKQQTFNHLVDESFVMMGHKLYEMIDGEFKGFFDQNWTNHYSELPGELSSEMRAVVHQNYFRLITQLKILMVELYQLNPRLFLNSLGSLCGFSQKEIIQVICIHQNNEMKDVVIKYYDDLFSENEFNLGFSDIELGGSSFEIRFKKFNLQIRIKPMNKFTTAAYKVNCSIKMKGESVE